MQESICHDWQMHVPSDTNAAWVLPDGCRDVILRLSDEREPHALLTHLDEQAVRVKLHPGETILGLRLAPGTGYKRRFLHLDRSSSNNPEDFLDHLKEGIVPASSQAAEALSLLATSSKDVRLSARRLGVSERTLRRTLSEATGWAPSKWMQLARVRICAKRLLVESSNPLADIAQDCGYSDQAHMTREMRRWFLVTPSEIRRRPDLHRLLFQPGLT